MSTSSGRFANGDIAEVINGRGYTFVCSVVGVRPKVTFKWTLENKEQTANNQVNQPNTDNRLMNCSSFLTVTPSFSSNHNDQLSCSASVLEDSISNTSTYVVLDVKGKEGTRGVFVAVNISEHECIG